MSLSSRRTPTRADLTFARALTGAAVILAAAVAISNLAVASDAPGDRAADLFTAAVAFSYAIMLMVLKMRGDFILGLFGYWWPFRLPRSDEMARSMRQEAFGFSYLVILGGVLAVALPVTVAVALSDDFGAWLSARVPEITARDVLACILGALIMLAALPQAYLAWTLAPLDPVEDEAEDAA